VALTCCYLIGGGASIDNRIQNVHTKAYDNAYREGGQMRTTLNIEDELLENAARLTGVKEKTSLVKLGLEALITKESAKRLAKLGGTEKKLEAVPRRRTGSI